MDPVVNFAKSALASGITSGATSLTLVSGGGAKFAAGGFNAVIYNSTDYSDPSDDPSVEVVRVGTISGDTLPITRAQESTSAVAHNTAGKTYRLVGGPLASLLSQIDSTYAAKATTLAGYGITDALGLHGMADYAGGITVADDHTTNGNFALLFAAASTGNLTVWNCATKLLFNPSTGLLSATTFAGAGTSLTGTAASLTAGKATVLATARAINGVNFDGSAAITVPAAAGTLTGATLNSTVVASSLTSVGALTSLATSGIGVFNFNSATAPTPIADTSLQLVGADTKQPRVLLDSFGAIGQFTARRANGTNASQTGLVADDIICQLAALGYTSAGAYQTTAHIFYRQNAAETWTATAQGAYHSWFTTAKGGTTTLEVMRLTDAGHLLIGTTTDSGLLTLQHAGNIGLTLRQNSTTDRCKLFVGDGTDGYTADEVFLQLVNTNLRVQAGTLGTAAVFDILADGTAVLRGSGGMVLKNDTTASIVTSSEALGTTATDGFLYIPTCAGTPTGTPTVQTGTVPIVYDTTGAKLWVYRGAAWHGIAI